MDKRLFDLDRTGFAGYVVQLALRIHLAGSGVWVCL